jgi:hypothetical protein
MSTKSGAMLQLLLETPSFKELFPESPYAKKTGQLTDIVVHPSQLQQHHPSMHPPSAIPHTSDAPSLSLQKFHAVANNTLTSSFERNSSSDTNSNPSAIFCDENRVAIVPPALLKKKGDMTPAEYFKQGNSGLVALPAESAGPAFGRSMMKINPSNPDKPCPFIWIWTPCPNIKCQCHRSLMHRSI